MISEPVAARDVVVVGRACRLPGAASVPELWDNLVSGRCSVSAIPADRWALPKHGHPRPKEPGRSYTWAAGVLDEIWAFDPQPFGLSPREAEQMDPHQRLLLELAWEALEDAGIPRGAIAGAPVGVYVGASSTEYQNLRNADLSTCDGYTATGGALSIFSNRLSHAFDLRGPSLTIDTACSSSLVALHHAMEAIRSGQIDTAIVGGVNLLLSPFGFVLFAQASMLSPTGLCRTFDAKADGYVRAEGGVVLVLRSQAAAEKGLNPIYARLVASGVNSDGRTNGIALPSPQSQLDLLLNVYGRAGLDAADLAFVEAHGTGTRVGDPMEASTIGEALGRKRPEPLPVGSIKSNIGHLEPASGLAGVLKASLALEHELLPATLHVGDPNPDIDFAGLNLAICREALPLPRGERPRFAGVNSFGFGGTNAHVVLADPRPVGARRKPSGDIGPAPDLFLLSAETWPAARALAGAYARQLAAASANEAHEIVAAAAHRRDAGAERALIVFESPRDLVRKLERLAEEGECSQLTRGTVVAAEAPVAFVFSGNGGQWPGMGRDAYRANRRFRETVDEIDALFDAAYGWSITEALFAPDLAERLRLTHVAQPLIFAIQVATARALAAAGLEPALVLGHSVGEIAAATVAEALSLREGVRVIGARSTRQEIARGAGRMAVLAGSREIVDEVCELVAGATVAAENSPRNHTVAGPAEAIERVGEQARLRRIPFRALDLDYPFHSELIDGVREPLLGDLAGLAPRATDLPIISTVSGEAVDGSALDGEYWWRNVREPVRFAAALETAASRGARIFIEIGPRSVLLAAMGETLDATGFSSARIGVLERRETEAGGDPIRPAVLAAFARGAPVRLDRLFGPPPSRPVRLPAYPWQRRAMRIPVSPEALGSALETRWHRLAGARASADGLEWRNLLDTAVLPELADHEVGGQAILPGAAFIEIAGAIGREWLGRETVAIEELDIAQALPLQAERTRELSCRLSPGTHVLEILSRPRLSRAGWTQHATARLSAGPERQPPPPAIDPVGEVIDGSAIYAAARVVGLRYGPAFRLATRVVRAGEHRFWVELAPSEPAASYGVDPARLDACFHGLFALLDELDAARRGTAFIPVRFGRVRLGTPAMDPVGAIIDIVRAGPDAVIADFTLVDAAGEAILFIGDARFQAVRVQRKPSLSEQAIVHETVPLDRGSLGLPGSTVRAADLAELPLALADGDRAPEALLLDGWALSSALEVLRDLAKDRLVPSAALTASKPGGAAWLGAMLQALAEHGLAEAVEGGWTLAGPDELPPAASVLGAIAEEAPGRSAELLLAGRLTGPAALAGEVAPPSHAALDGYELGGVFARDAAELTEQLLERTGALKGEGGGAARVLLLGFGPLASSLDRLVRTAGARLTILEPDGRRAKRARLAITGAHVTVAENPGDLRPAGYDLVACAGALHRLARAGVSLSDIQPALAPRGLLIAVEPGPSLFRDVALGLVPGWFEPGPPEFALSRLRGASEWKRELAASGLVESLARTLRAGGEDAVLLVAEAPGSGELARPRRVDVLAEGRFAEGVAARLSDALASDRPYTLEAVTLLIVDGRSARDGDEAAALSRACLALKRASEDLPDGPGELWTVALSGEDNPERDPFAAGFAAFGRALANERPGLTIRKLSVGADVEPDHLCTTLANLLAREQAETDVLVRRDGIRVLRATPLARARPAGVREARHAKLERGAAGGLAGLRWTTADLPELGPGDIEISVEATGLNFRDVMWAMSLLPDDILEGGFAGATLGLECAGTVSRVGPRARRFRPGDRVMAFAPGAFATAVRVPETVAALVPDGVSLKAAAGMPVAFLTAYHGLVSLARLRAGEWVLIHGAAGGVGLAAIQVARAVGATMVATAGTPEKRDLLRALGVEHVLDSRSTDFADELRRIRRDGVDVVLNSLAGEAMEQSVGALRAFGRFVELGKRDYVANTRLGLRPFRRNLSYFGVDVDQLLSDGDRASELFSEVMSLVERGELKPIPFRVFPAAETVDAFRLMQASGHAGKIVVRPPEHGVPDESGGQRFRIDPNRTHLITGAFGGFGLEAARWLADRGARHLALIGRTGPSGEEAQALLADLRALGVTVRAEACDVADEGALSSLLDSIGREMPPLAGILHAAMVLEDGLISGLSEAALERVLRPKAIGAALLDRLTERIPLDYFVLFSSLTTVIGNPGQGAYVAANGYLEGLARRRRARGRPALAVAWGAISDVGVLARRPGLADALSRRAGVKAMPARQALDLMAEALGSPQDSASAGAVLAIGGLDWGAARRLPALASPTFSGLPLGEGGSEGGERASFRLADLVATAPPESVRARVLEVILEEIAGVLRVPKTDVPASKRLAEIGLDSLMAVELAAALGERMEIDQQPAGAVGTMTATTLADHLIGSVAAGASGDGARVSEALNERHAGIDVEAAGLRPLVEAVSAGGREHTSLTQ